MGLFGHNGKLSKIGHEVGDTLKHYDEILRSHGAPDFYVGFSQDTSTGEVTPKATVNTNNKVQGTTGTGKPSGYSRTTAATAKDIAQGGMTKDEVIEYNIKHPNETALRG